MNILPLPLTCGAAGFAMFGNTVTGNVLQSLSK